MERIQARTLDANRPEAVARRHALGQRTARENIADLCDADSFIEYGALAVIDPAQTRAWLLRGLQVQGPPPAARALAIDAW